MKIVLKKLSEIHPYEANPRINEPAIDAVAASLKEFGFRQPIVVDADMTIIAGHTRWKAAQRLGLELVPVHVADTLTPAQVRAYRLADNRTAEIADWDMGKLTIELEQLRAENYDLTLTAFGELEIDRMLKTVADSSREDDAPPLPEIPVSEPGKIYALGLHRLMCGDSLDPACVARLTGKRLANLVFTDPPYNMNYQSKNLGGIKNDKMSEANFVSFILSSVMSMKKAMASNASYYICMSAAEYPTVYHQLRKAGMSGRQIIWVKPSAGLGGQEYRPQYEVMLYGYLSREHRTWNGERLMSDLWDFDPAIPVIAREEDNSTVIEFGNGIETTQVCVDGLASGNVIFFDGSTSDLWRFKRPEGTYVHPTQKPVALVERALKNSSNPGDLVLDLFGGSGSTLIAAERTGRDACLMELDPRYCDVIRRRYVTHIQGSDEHWLSLTPELP